VGGSFEQQLCEILRWDAYKSLAGQRDKQESEDDSNTDNGSLDEIEDILNFLQDLIDLPVKPESFSKHQTRTGYVMINCHLDRC
jgi:hypothetical protein